MESIRIDILNPKAKKILQDLAALDLISIREKLDSKSAFKNLLIRLRNQSDRAPSMEEITEEMEAARKERYD
ncbi:MAG: hypothetical protein OEW67_13205 [Cyclobacteriaceae bacterium]|nr:hypothetical protein [Cyclobacteriaceae bacterium]